MCQKINRVRREVGRGEFPGQSSNLASLGNSKCDQKVKIQDMYLCDTMIMTRRIKSSLSGGRNSSVGAKLCFMSVW